jgi:dihydropteroate synthase
MHLRGTPQSMKWSTKFKIRISGSNDLIGEIKEFWLERIKVARAHGIRDDRICLDAGFGFGKSVEENLEILRFGSTLSAFGFPTLSGTSRKSTIGKILGEAPVEERIFGTAATVAIAIYNGADIVRVHDVKQMKQVALMVDAIG